ncbi:ABC transporter ATP-binding protein [Glutamicibacter soli]|uniref:ABC transporter ATP-binding protein n=1 Tax=Micrococcaceae TaxID=1268 RepID=UPI00063DA23B|nr:ABC transporter ATP-binding protein [Arthrobacter sp. YC-RL1]ALQ31934.1 hypothetical protein ATC04_16215 [Arthrobacter sp. YC-RL1]KLI90237.1 hypothetical protein AA310_02405 [Arthrobacter sp. YC-RL1]
MATESETRTHLEARGLVIGYPERTICGPLNLKIGTGDGLGIIGSNGSGKSTLLATLLGRTPAQSGETAFRGLPLDEDSLDFRRNVAVQVSDGAFFEELSVAEHLEMVARGHSVPGWEKKVQNELEFFELTTVAGHLPGELSSGQRRKLLLAATLIRPAELLILDEPEQRLDLRIRQQFYERLAGLRREAVSILAVTHDPAMLRLCLDQALLLDGDTGEYLESERGAQWLER